MGLIKCPRCELNYMPDTERYCTVCKREMRGEEDREDIEICPECGEHPVVLDEELCAVCLKEIHRQERAAPEEEERIVTDEVGELDAASGMNEIDIAMDQDIPSAEFKEINRELDIEDGEEDEEDEEDDFLHDDLDEDKEDEDD